MQRHLHFSLFGIALIVLVTFVTRSFPTPTVPVTGTTISYSKDIQPIFESRCVLCHGVQRIRDGLDLRTYQSLMQGSRSGAVIVPGEAEDSLLVHKIENGDMPKVGPRLFPVQLHKIIDWINAGAPNN